LRDGGQKGTRLLQGQRFFACQQAHERVVHEIGCLMRIAELLAKPAPQPAMVIAVEAFDLLLKCVGRHNVLACAQAGASSIMRMVRIIDTSVQAPQSMRCAYATLPTNHFRSGWNLPQSIQT